MRLVLLSLLSIVFASSKCQIINGYANVTAISGTTLTVSSVDETTHTFEDGDEIVLMQMQDNCIGSNTTNVSTFGDLAAIQSAGRYEILRILSHTESAGLPATIVVSAAPINSYNFNANASVQLITFRSYGAPSYTTTSNMSAKAWNGTTGGVLAFQVTGTLTLAHNLNATGLGFRGGGVSTNYYAGGSGCLTTEYIRTANHNRAALKGEGIYKTATTDFLYARGHLLNGGGGGSEWINCGGGGGGNYTAGGTGGDGWSCAGPGGGGLGGVSFSTQISASRIFMGGGGGGGQQNNSASTPGGNGGGIILLKAGSIITQGACAGRIISANGNTVTGLSNDGQGGGGAAGSIVIQTSAFNIVGACALTVSANGGGGGTVNTSAHAGGGGGAQGVVIYSIAQPTLNVSTRVNNGSAGCNDNSSPCTNVAGAPTGTNNTGVISAASGPLPINLVDFNAALNLSGEAQLVWKTLSEKNNEFYELQRSEDGQEWTIICIKKGGGNTTQERTYTHNDANLLLDKIYYYRLRQIDFDKTFTFSPIISLNTKDINSTNISIFPNPNNGRSFALNVDAQINSEIAVTVYSAVGKEVYKNFYRADSKKPTFEIIPDFKLSAGIYLFSVEINQKTYFQKLVVNE